MSMVSWMLNSILQSCKVLHPFLFVRRICVARDSNWYHLYSWSVMCSDWNRSEGQGKHFWPVYHYISKNFIVFTKVQKKHRPIIFKYLSKKYLIKIKHLSKIIWNFVKIVFIVGVQKKILPQLKTLVRVEGRAGESCVTSMSIWCVWYKGWGEIRRHYQKNRILALLIYDVHGYYHYKISLLSKFNDKTKECHKRLLL